MELWGDPQVTALIGGPFSPEAVRARLEAEIAQMQRRGIQYWPIFLLEGNRFVGCAGLRPYRFDDRNYELGFHLCRAFWQQGFALEAAAAVIDHAFGSLNVPAVFAGHHPSNEASRRVLLKLGFLYTHDELYAPTGLLHPSYLLARP
jgi:RimJ/RimL family protein N-acetyltransferase